MEDRIRKQFNDAILNEIVSRFDLNHDETRPLDGFESFIFITNRHSGQYVLRVSHSIRRTKGQLLGELGFLRYLKANGLNVPAVHESINGALVEEVAANDGSFLACLFEFIDGTVPEIRDSGFIVSMGEYLGRLHRLSKAYRPGLIDRPDFFAETVPLFDFIPKRDARIRQIAQATAEKIRTMPKTGSTYGLIHVDFHCGNFLIRDGEIVLFDFDDCQFSWYIHDIAMALFYFLPHGDRSETVIAAGHEFLKHFAAGYARNNDLDKEMLRTIEDFLKIREIELYAVINRSFDVNALDDWCKSFMTGRKEKIENRVPYFALDLERIS